MMSSLVFIAKSYAISGFGFAIAKTMGFFFIDNNIFGVTIFSLERPIKISELIMASSKVFIFLFVANSFFSLDSSFLLDLITPLLSVIIMFLGSIPKALYILVHEIAAAPAPQTTIFTFSIFFSTISKAFNKAAEEIIAVPC